MICTTNDQHGIRVLARWHREHHARRELAPTGEAADIARCNLRALGREETPEAVWAEMVRMERDNRLAAGLLAVRTCA